MRRREVLDRLGELSQRLTILESAVSELHAEVARRAPLSEVERLNLAFEELARKAPLSEAERLDAAFEELARKAPLSEVERLDQAFDELAQKAPLSETARLDKAFEELAQKATEDSIDRLDAALSALTRDMRGLWGLLSQTEVAEVPRAAEVNEHLPPGFDALYARLEQRFRGSRLAINERLVVYLPEVASLAGGETRVLDLGCGRGEWLELLAGAGVPAYGIDLNEGFVAACRERGLVVEHADARAHLEGLPGGSLGAVTAFHVAEHLPFDRLVTVLDASYRALRPGGPLIIETPNPRNMVVSTCTFYLDPTHRAPLPPELLIEVAHHCGFRDIDVRFLNPVVADRFVVPDERNDVMASLQPVLDRLNDAFFGPMDYAVVAHRPDTDG